MDTAFMKKVEEKYVKRETDIRPGDTVKVHLRITEAGKERIQIFEGVVISVNGQGLGTMVTIRKMSHGVGVEKIIPINSPMVKKIDVVKRGNVRRSKLYYMRRKIGKRSLDVSMDENFEELIEEDTVDQDAASEEKVVDGDVSEDAKEAAVSDSKKDSEDNDGATADDEDTGTETEEDKKEKGKPE